MRPSGRLWIAFVVTPLVPSAIFLLLPPMGMTGVAWWTASFALPFSIGSELLIGAPLHFLFRRRCWTSVLAYGAIGASCAIGAAFVLLGLPMVYNLLKGEPVYFGPPLVLTAIFCVPGVISGCVFWWIARPDRPVPPEGG
jgi:hypothetical protein